MNYERVKIAYSLAERPLKLLINHYFNYIVNYIKLHNIKLHTLSIEYQNYIKMLNIQNQLPKEFWIHTGLSVIPKKTGNLKMIGSQTGIIYWDIVSKDCEWDSDKIDNLTYADKIKDTIGDLFPLARFVFILLKKKFPLLESLELKTDPNNLTLYLYDTQFKDIDFSERLGVIIRI